MTSETSDIAQSDRASATEPGVPTFIETAPGAFTPLEQCSKAQIAAEIMALLGRADAIMDSHGHGMEPDSDAAVRSLIYEATQLGEYLNV